MEPITVGTLRAMLAKINPSTKIVLLSDEEGNDLHFLYAVEHGTLADGSKAIFLTPAGDSVEE